MTNEDRIKEVRQILEQFDSGLISADECVAKIALVAYAFDETDYEGE